MSLLVLSEKKRMFSGGDGPRASSCDARKRAHVLERCRARRALQAQKKKDSNALEQRLLLSNDGLEVLRFSFVLVLLTTGVSR